jgi:apolipoprotein N-acyltransferase
MIAQAARRIGGLTGWRRLIAAFVAGAVTLFALPPFSVVPALWLAFPPLIWMLDGCKTRFAAGLTGWAFGFGFFATGIYWITNAFYVDTETFGAIAMPAVMALAAAIGLFMTVIAVITHIIPPPDDDDMPDDRVAVMALRIVLFAAAWTLMEWLRSWIFTGFPWNPMAAVWSETATPIGVPIIQITPLIGTYGLSFLTVLAAAAPAVLAHRPRFRRAWLVATAPMILLIVIGAAGALRLATAKNEFVPDVKFRLVQANIPQTDRQRPSLWESQLQDYIDLSTRDRPADITHVVWGEAAVPPTFFLNLDDRRRRGAAMAAPPSGLLITGGDRGLRDDDSWTAIYNSLYVLTPDAAIVGTYDKTHLVPFGEYMPLRRFIPFEKITGGIGDFAAGDGLKTLSVPGLPPFTPLICYEAIFSGNVTPDGQPRPRWLLNLTNDAWFGMSTGPYQHLAMARLRAVEEGLPLVRTANTGVSAVIDGYGRSVASLGLGQRGVVDSPLPTPAAAFTPFGSAGNFIPLMIATLSGALALIIQRQRTYRGSAKRSTRRASR